MGPRVSRPAGGRQLLPILPIMERSTPIMAPAMERDTAKESPPNRGPIAGAPAGWAQPINSRTGA